MAVQTSYVDWSTRSTWNGYSFHAEDKVRDSGGDDPADLHIAFEQAKAKADAEAERNPRMCAGEPTYTAYVRVVRSHTEKPVKA